MLSERGWCWLRSVSIRLNHNPITIALLMAPLSHNNVLHCFVLEIAFSIDQDQPRQQRASRATMDNEFMCI